MSADLVLPLIMRWVHILCAVTVAGSIIFYYLIYMKAASGVLSDEDAEKLRWTIMKKWKLFLHPPIILFLISGFYTYAVTGAQQHQEQPLYHALFGVKFLLAIAVFALFIILTSTMNWSANLRNKNGLWTLLTLMVIAVVLLGGVLRILPINTVTP